MNYTNNIAMRVWMMCRNSWRKALPLIWWKSLEWMCRWETMCWVLWMQIPTPLLLGTISNWTIYPNYELDIVMIVWYCRFVLQLHFNKVVCYVSMIVIFIGNLSLTFILIHRSIRRCRTRNSQRSVQNAAIRGRTPPDLSRQSTRAGTGNCVSLSNESIRLYCTHWIVSYCSSQLSTSTYKRSNKWRNRWKASSTSILSSYIDLAFNRIRSEELSFWKMCSDDQLKSWLPSKIRLCSNECFSPVES